MSFNCHTCGEIPPSCRCADDAADWWDSLDIQKRRTIVSLAIDAKWDFDSLTKKDQQYVIQAYQNSKEPDEGF